MARGAVLGLMTRVAELEFELAYAERRAWPVRRGYTHREVDEARVRREAIAGRAWMKDQDRAVAFAPQAPRK